MVDLINLANSIVDSKEKIRQAINSKGVEVDKTVRFEEYPDKISAINLNTGTTGSGIDIMVNNQTLQAAEAGDKVWLKNKAYSSMEAPLNKQSDVNSNYDATPIFDNTGNYIYSTNGTYKINFADKSLVKLNDANNFCSPFRSTKTFTRVPNSNIYYTNRGSSEYIYNAYESLRTANYVTQAIVNKPEWINAGGVIKEINKITGEEIVIQQLSDSAQGGIFLNNKDLYFSENSYNWKHYTYDESTKTFSKQSDTLTVPILGYSYATACVTKDENWIVSIYAKFSKKTANGYVEVDPKEISIKLAELLEIYGTSRLSCYYDNIGDFLCFYRCRTAGSATADSYVLLKYQDGKWVDMGLDLTDLPYYNESSSNIYGLNFSPDMKKLLVTYYNGVTSSTACYLYFLGYEYGWKAYTFDKIMIGDNDMYTGIVKTGGNINENIEVTTALPPKVTQEVTVNVDNATITMEM